MSAQIAIQEFIRDEILLGDSSLLADPDQDLVSAGILDSLALLRLVVFIEEKLGLDVSDGDIVVSNFQTINRINSFVEDKQTEKVQP